MKHGICTLVLLAAMAFAYVPTASAHDVFRRTVVVYDGSAVAKYRGVAPLWLHRHRPFQRWYLASRYRYVHRLTWPQLYDLYRVEVRHTRPVRQVYWRGHDYHRHCRHR